MDERDQGIVLQEELQFDIYLSRDPGEDLVDERDQGIVLQEEQFPTGNQVRKQNKKWILPV